ncbi:branched-chain amino acid transport system II carrier protein [Pseudaeromonas sharmana]|uniref:Branched-chain amino acid transport system carrier protein n=1 Tax=Pseudaeromonas sharmana TaxID=328412 RepID=A0ABV8CMJ3_9GAMM
MKTTDIIGLGFMTFAFFLGAGNIIFPPMAGFLAGESMSWAMLGFLLTGVGLPLLTILAVARAGGGLLTMTRLLPPSIGVAIAVAAYLIIGPAFATPRTGLVAYEMGVKPFLGDGASQGTLIGFTVAYFGLTLFLSLNQGRLLDAIGKVLTPVLVLLLLVLAVAVLIAPQGVVPAASGDYVANPGIKGLLEGYNTMDTFGALMFGMLIIDVLRDKGVTDKTLQTRYLIRAGVIAAVGLAFVYVSLFQLGATSGGLMVNPTNGGEIVALYVSKLFGSAGQLILAAIVSLACLTTAVGLTSACADFFHTLWPRLSYRALVVVMCATCALVANVGLSTLIALSIPVLVAIYPVAIALVAMTFLKDYYAHPRLAFRLVLLVSMLFGALDGLKTAGVNLDLFNFLPLFSLGLAWILPTLVAMVLAWLPRQPVCGLAEEQA